MSRALVIKGANFSANKVEVITLSEPIPCTGISLSQNSITFTSVGSTVQLTATVVPLDTTDNVTWSSSNDNIATVVNGLVTCTGVGSASITAMCGSQSATCSVSATHTFVVDDAYFPENGMKYSGSLDLTKDPPHNQIGKTSQTRARIYYSIAEYGDYRVFANQAYDGEYAIPIPYGTTKLTVSPPEGLQTYTDLVLCNVNEKQTYVSGADGNAVLGLAAYSKGTSGYPWETDISSIAGANGFILSVIGPSGTDASENTGKTTIICS